AQTELVQLRGQWVRLDPVTLRAAERFLDAFTSRTQQNRAGGHEDGSDGQGGPTHTPQAADGRTPPRAAAPAGPLEVGYPEGARPAELAGLAPWAEMFSLILSPDAADVDFGVAALTAGGTNGLARLMPGGSGRSRRLGRDALPAPVARGRRGGLRGRGADRRRRQRPGAADAGRVRRPPAPAAQRAARDPPAQLVGRQGGAQRGGPAGA